MNAEEIRRAIERATEDELRHDWPYGFNVTAAGIVALNRHYKPCGLRTREWVDYEPHRRPCQQLDRAVLRRAASEWREREVETNLWLFHDGCPPWRGARHRRAYADRVITVLVALGACRHDTQPSRDT